MDKCFILWIYCGGNLHIYSSILCTWITTRFSQQKQFPFTCTHLPFTTCITVHIKIGVVLSTLWMDVCACYEEIKKDISLRSHTLHCKKNWSENKSLFRIPITPTVFSISGVQNLCSSPLSFFKIIEVGKRTLTLRMETNSISMSKKYFRCICLNKVGTFLSVSSFFSIGWNCSLCK